MLELSKMFIAVDTLPEGMYGFIQLMFLFVCYGYVLMTASNMISDGSELLLLVPKLAGIVGSIVLPILGAVPDGCIVLFSGMGPDAQNQLAVGVGALAGSTIMLLTIPWSLSVIAGRVDIKDGYPNYKGRPKLSPENESSLTATGVVLGHNVHIGSWIMMGTSLTYLILQGPGLFYEGETTLEVAEHENSWALLGLVVCTALFAAYLWYQYRVAQSEDAHSTFNERRDRVISTSIEHGEISLFGALSSEMNNGDNKAVGEGSTLFNYEKERKIQRLESILRSFFRKYDVDNSNSLSMDELSSVFRDMGEDIPNSVLATRFKKYDTNGNGSIDFQEFVNGTYELLSSSTEVRDLYARKGVKTSHTNLEAGAAESKKAAEEDDGEEEEEIPEDLAHLSPEEQQYRVKLRAAYMMGLGTLLVVIFSDPMVEVLNEIGVRIGVNPFYVAFVLAPLASNASELIASVNYAAKKTPKSISISIATLEGAACMNNTFGLAIFMFLVYYQGLAWQYLAETAVILVVQVAVGILAMKRFHTIQDALLILALYPASLAACAWLESIGWN